MSRKQALFIEGIRYSMETADLAHVRLQATLPLLTKGDQLLPEDRLTASAMLDAWAIVDSLHRLRGLLRHMPGIQRRDRIPPIRAFFDATDQVTELRNTIQHLDTTIPGILDDHNWAVFGSLTWGIVDPEKNQITSSCFMPGMPVGQRTLINPADRPKWHIPIDAITIERSGVRVCLSDAMRRTEVLAKALEKMLAVTYTEQMPNSPTHGADLTLSLVFGIAPEKVVAADVPDPDPVIPPEEPSESG